MEVNDITGLRVGPLNGEVPSVERSPNRAKDQTRFVAAEALNRGLASETTVRGEEVERGKELVAMLTYPPEEVIRGLSRLLAEQWDRCSHYSEPLPSTDEG